MKKIIFFLGFLLAFTLTQAQESSEYVQLIQNEAGQFRFQKLQVNQYEALTDTLIKERFPDRWLDSVELRSYQEGLIAQNIERQLELRRLFQISKGEADTQISIYDSIFGEGAYLALQKQKVLQSLQGDWRLVDRNGEITSLDITVTGNDFRRNEQRFGTVTVTDDLTVLLTGFYAFDLTFTPLANGTWRATRGDRLFILRK